MAGQAGTPGTQAGDTVQVHPALLPHPEMLRLRLSRHELGSVLQPGQGSSTTQVHLLHFTEAGSCSGHGG